MTKWFKCNKCDFTSMSSESLIRHLKNKHCIVKKSDGTLQEFMVTNQQEMEDLKKREISSKFFNGNLLEMRSGIQFKDEIEIEEHSIEDDDDDAMSKDNASMEADPSDLNTEWLILGL